MKLSFRIPLALMSGLSLPACGARSSLAEPGVSDECVPWVVHDSVAGTVHYAHPVFAVLDAGSVIGEVSETNNVIAASTKLTIV